jgi:hypothetical protein
MNAIPGNNASPQWNSTLLNDLVFIKKHLRYRLSRRIFLFIILLISAWGLIYTRLMSNNNISVSLWIGMAAMILSSMVAIYNAYSVLKFKSIPTGFSGTENAKLIEDFLRSRQLNLYRHPQAPDVFQILSRPLGNKADQREVMIFIADEGRILINSHFINQKWTRSPQSRNYKRMAKELKEWLKIQHPETAIAAR